MEAHHKHAGGDSQILHADPDLYIMQRVGWKDESVDQPGLIYVLNNPGRQVEWHVGEDQVGKPEVCANCVGRAR